MAETLKDLLEQAKEKRGVTSGRALADLTSEREHSINRTQVNAILGGTYHSKPGHELIKAVAWLAQVDEQVAYAAAGVPVPGKPFADELPPNVDYLGPHQRHAVITVIRAFLGAAGEEGGEGHAGPAPTNEPGSGPGSSSGESLPKNVTQLSPGRSTVQGDRTKKVAKKRPPRGEDDDSR